MMIKYHNSCRRRVALTLLAAICVSCAFGLLASPILAAEGGDCGEACQSPLTNEIHTPPDGTDLDNCPAPKPNFCACPREGCDSLTVAFTDWSIGYIDTWEWDFGDPASGADNYSNLENPIHFYGRPGAYTVRLTVTGCGGTVTKTRIDWIIIRTSPAADFVADPLEGCAPLTVDFHGLSPEATWWRWNFGDPASGANDTSYAENPTHVYSNPGTYTVSLRVANSCGNDKLVREEYITVHPGPTADFEAVPRSGPAPLAVDFTDLSTSQLGLTAWLWDFGDGNNSTVQNPNHIYTVPGYYTVVLKVFDPCGEDTATKIEYIYVIEPCTIDFVGDPTEICEGETAHFSATSTGPCEISSWLWDFGDGSTGTGQQTQHTYNAAGVYTVTLTASDITGDIVVTKTDYVTVNAGPTAGFSANPTSGVAPLDVTFTDLSTSVVGIYTWEWDFGDGSTSGTSDPVHTYTAGGIYTVTLTVTDECGSDSYTGLIEVNDPCDVDFFSEAPNICVGESADFTGTSTGDCQIGFWTWDFGDGSTGMGRQTQHTYNTAGVYTVTLTATDITGVTVVTKTDYVTVNPGPTADFSANPTTGVAPLTVDFTDLSTSVVGMGLYTWYFGDGSTSSDQDPTHTYTVAGDYTVILEVQDECGIDSETREIHVTNPCTVNFFGDPREVCEGETVDFSTTTYNETCQVDSWTWDFGDPASGGSNTGSGTNPQHVYNTAGLYTVTMTATIASNDTVITKADFVTVYANPTADFYATPLSGMAPLTVDFTDRSSGSYGSIVRWTWDFGDGGSSSDQNPSHTYTAAGDYTVTLDVYDGLCDDREIKEVYVRVEEDCRVDFFGEPREICEGETVYFSTTTYNEACQVDSWTWDFGDPASGGSNTGSGTNPQHVYNTAGLYTVTMTATIAGSDTVLTKTDFVTVNPGPTAGFSATPLSGMAPLTVDFIDMSTSVVGIHTWEWNFGDGGTSASQHPVHTYTTAGLFMVTLTVTDECGSDSEEHLIEITVPCEVDFSGEPPELCVGETADFAGTSAGDCEIGSWSWTFGDGSAGSGQQTQHTYNTAGVYTVTLTATDITGVIVVTKTDYVTVNPGPTADFSANPTTGAAPLDVVFTNQSTSTVGFDSVLWDFDDGTASRIQHPTHTFTAPGTYTVTLTVWDGCGSDSHTADIYVPEECVIDFFGEPLEICEGETANFSATSTGPCEIESWTWDFGDPASGSANTGHGQQAQHVYHIAGVYTVILTAEEAGGTQVVTKVDYITVNSGPTADISAAPTSGMAPLTVDFTDLSTSVSGITSWLWEFGDGSGSTAQNPTYTYTATGTYAVSLIVVDPCGADTATTEISVGPAISITKLVDKVVAAPGGELLYTLTVHNLSDLPIPSVMVIDTIPDSTGYIDRSVSPGGVYLPNSGVVMWSVPVVWADSSVELSFRVVLDGPFVQFPIIVSNQAIARVEDGGIATSTRTFYSNIVETVVNDEPTGVLEISKSVSAALASPNDLLTYTITIRNPGPLSSADNVVVYDQIPDSTTFAAGSVTGGGSHRVADDSLHWHLGTLAAFASRTVSFQVTVDPDVADGSRIPNTALVRYMMNGSPQADESNEVITAISLVPLVVTKTTNRPSGMVGDLIRFAITIENFSDDLFEEVLLTDTMPAGIFYVDGTSLVDGVAAADPAGANPFEWALGDLPAGGKLTVQYVGLIGASAHPAVNENIARAVAYQSGVLTRSNRAVANIYVLGHTLTGSIRGRVIVDCDGDGVADIDSVPSGIDVFLDEGSQSRVNNKGMFYFSTVRPGERVVALDERDLNGFYVPEGAQASVFVHVHETGESYVIFRICPEYPHLEISKKAAIVPTVKVTKVATLDASRQVGNSGVTIDYEIDIMSNGLADATQVRVVDSFPDNMHLILAETETLAPRRAGNQLIYEVTAAQERLQKSVRYSLQDLAPGVRRFLSNRVRLEGDLTRRGAETRTTSSEPIEVAVGPFLMAPPGDVQITLTPALFRTSYAILRPEAIPELHIVADSIAKYPDADIRVEGHTDLRPIHTAQFPSNWELGEGRARVVVDWLVENGGIDRDRLEYESFAATRPVVVDVALTSAALQPNRRTEVIIKTSVAGFLAPSAEPTNRWESSTSMALEPVKFDTLFEPSPSPVVANLDDSWEIVLTVENRSAIPAENTILTDILPDGVQFVEGSATIDGMSAPATVNGRTLSLSLTPVNPAQILELRYRVQALPGATPSGGGAASIEVMTSDNLPVVQKSNDVRFR